MESADAEAENLDAEADIEAESGDDEEIEEDSTKPQLLVVTSGVMGKRSYV